MDVIKGPDKTYEFLRAPCILKIPVELYRGEKLFRGFLLSISKKLLKLQLLESISDVKIKKTEFLKIQFVFQGERYQLLSRPIRYFINENSLDMEVPYLIENVNMRKFVRLTLDFPLKTYFSFNNKVSLGLINNISEGGIYMTGTRLLKRREIYPLAITLPAGQELKSMFLSAGVAHSKDADDRSKYTAGLEFTHLQDKTSIRIKNFVWVLNIWKEIGLESPPEVKDTANPDLIRLQRHFEAFLQQFSEMVKTEKIIPPTLEAKAFPYSFGQDENLGKKRILCIEDNMVGRNTLQRILSPYYEVDFVHNPLGTVAKMTKFRPHLVMSDVDMGEADFFMIRKAAKRFERLKDIPFVIYSNNSDEQVILRALKYGDISEYIIKPIEPKELIDRLTQVIDSA